MRRLITLVAACGGPTPPTAPPEPPRPDARPPYTTHALDSLPGLSGLGAAPDGALWTVAERGGVAYRIVVDGDQLVSLDSVPLDGLPDVDVESIEPLDDRRFLLGTEGRDTAELMLATLHGTRLEVDPTGLGAASLGVTVEPNHGIEGLCADQGAIVLAFETPVDTGESRWAQLAVCGDLDPARCELHQVQLTSATGKISAIDCTTSPAVDGGIHVIAIERHFEVTRILDFTLPRPGAPFSTVIPTVMKDLAAIANGRNFEGLAIVGMQLGLVVDNQWKEITGPSELLLLSP
jgi:hypothetical protein